MTLKLSHNKYSMMRLSELYNVIDKACQEMIRSERLQQRRVMSIEFLTPLSDSLENL